MNVGAQVQALNDKAYYYHIDILDWHFAKNLCFSPDFVEQLRAITDVPLDVHLMVEGVDLETIKIFLDAGSDIITFHHDGVSRNIFKYIDYVKSRGKKVGIVMDASLPLDAMRYYIDQLDLITFLAVTAGFAGQKLIPPVLDKIREAHELREKYGYKFETQIDGGCTLDTIKEVTATNLDIVIVGKTLLFGLDKDAGKAWDMMEANFKAALAK